MERQECRFTVTAEDQAAAGRGAQALADTLREAEGVLEADRRKADGTTMDLGTIVDVIANSGATLAIAAGIAAWLRTRKQASITVERNSKTGSIKAAVTGIDAEAATRIAEIVRDS
jgi:Effector Associated Constant Component 1